MADEDFEIDIYGTADNDNNNTNQEPSASNGQSYESNTAITVANGSNNSTHPQSNNQEDYDAEDRNGDEMEASELDSATHSQQPQQGTKRKQEGSDERPIDPGATNCLQISELNWWNTDDEIRKWVRQAGCEEELKDITFSEHKVNGKSKGAAYIELSSQQAATAVKYQIDTSDGPAGGKKPTTIYASPSNNPFRTLPKDAPARGKQDQSSRGGPVSGGYNNDRGSYTGGSGYRGRGNFQNGIRGGGFNRNFSGGNMGGGFPSNNMGGGFNPNMGGGFNSGFNNRGGNMMGGGMRGGQGGMRGGRGGMNNMMGNMGNMGMPMGGMPMGMMGGGMPGFNGMQTHFNPAFFGGNQSGGNEWQNPHGAKRPRGE